MAPIAIISLLYLLCLSCFFCFGQDVFSVTRSELISYDVFEVPSSKCSYCSSYVGATSHDLPNCKCACKYESSTFGFHTSAWTCQGNTEVRSQAGCTFHFKEKIDKDPVLVLSEGSSYKVVLPSLDCSIEYSSSKFFKCKSWNRLDTLVSAPGPFLQFPIIENIQGKKIYTIQVNAESLLRGMLISLRFKCTKTTSCIIFKMAGDIQCPVNTTLITTQSTTVTTTSLPSDTTKQPSMSSVIDPETKPSSTASNSLPVTSVTSAQSTQSPGPAGEGRPHSNDNESSTGIIAAVAVVVIFVIIIVILFGYIFWKRKRGENVWLLDKLQSIASKARSSPSKTYKQDEPAEEDIYAEIPERPNVAVVDRRTNAPSKEMYRFDFGDPDSAYAQPLETDDGSLYEEAGSMIQGRLSIHDDQGYVCPADSPRLPLARKPPVVMNEQESPDTEQNYNILEDPNGEANSTEVTTVGAGIDPRYVPRRGRRRPPSPPRRNDNIPSHIIELGIDNNAGNYNDDTDRTSTYEELKDEGRPPSFYESLDHSTLSRSR